MKIEELYSCANAPALKDKVVYANGHLQDRKYIVVKFAYFAGSLFLILIEEENISEVRYALPNMLKLVSSKSTV